MNAHVLANVIEERRTVHRRVRQEVKAAFGMDGVQSYVAPGTWPSGLTHHYLITQRGGTVEYRRVESVARLEGDYADFVLVFLVDEEHPLVMHKGQMVSADSGVIGSCPGGGD